MSNRRFSRFAKNVDNTGKISASVFVSDADKSSVVPTDSAGVLPLSNLSPGQLSFDKKNKIPYISNGTGWSKLTIANDEFTVLETISTLSTSNVTFAGYQGIEVTQDGNYLLQAVNESDPNGQVYIWPMTTAYSLTSTGSRQSDATTIQSANDDDWMGGIRVSADLSKAFMVNWATADMYEFTQVSSNTDYPGHVSQNAAATSTGNTYFYMNADNGRWDFAKDGSAVFGVNVNERLWIHKMTTAYDITSFETNPAGNINLPGETGTSWNVAAVAVNGDGTRCWVGGSDNKIYQFSFSTPNDHTTLSYDGYHDYGSSIQGLAYANKYLYVEKNGSVDQLGN